MWHSEKVATSKVYDKPALAFLVGPAYFKEVLLWHNTWKLKPREFKADEIRIALKQMHPTKALGPDGMSLIFYQKYSDVVGSNVINCVMNTLNSGIMPQGLNETYICLIPKVKCPQKNH